MFYFGAATSAHQVEGGNKNDWSEWEKKTARKKAQAARTNLPVGGWPEYILKRFPNPLVPENYISGNACEHYRLFREDFKLAKKLGHNAHRLSIEWSRIEPREGKFDERAISHYREVIEELTRNKLEPFLTLWHWTLPLWIEKQGGWLNKNTPLHFARFAEKVASAIGPRAQFWITLNEPEIYSMNSYLKGVWPPERKSFLQYLLVLHRLIAAHNAASRALKKVNPAFQVGIAKNNIYFEAHRGKIINRIIKAGADRWWNFYLLNRIRSRLDFIGLNYYFHNRIDRGFNKNENKLVSDTGWELYPQGLYHALSEISRYKKPIYITENGLADAEDTYREWFIRAAFDQIIRALKAGINVRGYFYWSLLDNFEWDKGFWPRFGLIEVDYKTMKRKIRKSALVYKNLIKVWERI